MSAGGSRSARGTVPRGGRTPTDSMGHLVAGHPPRSIAVLLLTAVALAAASACLLLPGSGGGPIGLDAPDTGTATVAPADTATATPTGTSTPTREPVVALATATPVRVSIPRGETVVPIPTATPVPGGRPIAGGCYVFPADNPWNQDISALPVDANSANYIASIMQSGNGFLHADFGSNPDYGIPYVIVPQTQALVPITYTMYGDESDPGPMPVPLNAPVEGGGAGDAHVIALQQGTCKVYELYAAQQAGAGWDAGSGAIFDLNSNALRPDSWTSADAAGLPIFAGLARYDEVQAGAINHALRFTVGTVQRAWVHPATHYGTSSDVNRPPYGARLRLKASFDTSAYHGHARVILEALKKYGMIVADQGTSWFITGAPDPRWDDADLDQLKTVPGSAFEVVQLGPIYRP